MSRAANRATIRPRAPMNSHANPRRPLFMARAKPRAPAARHGAPPHPSQGRATLMEPSPVTVNWISNWMHQTHSACMSQGLMMPW